MNSYEPSVLDSTQAPPLDKRYELIDILFGIMMPGFIASAWPLPNANQRIVMLVVLLALAAASVWWGASVCHSFKIHRTLPRLLVHSYSFSAFISFVGCLPFLVFTFSALDRDRTMPPVAWLHLLRFGGCLLGVGLVISMFWVERARARLRRVTQLEQKWRENVPQP